jgi:outer membrane lipoprotein
VFPLLGACAYDPGVVPRALQNQVDRTVEFNQLKASPSSYSGRLLVLGGEVLSAKRLKGGTRIEVLQLPLDDAQEPSLERTRSEGRFLVVQKDFLDPATIPAGTRITVTGEVIGATTLPLDETEYTYPTLEVKNLKVWPRFRQPYAYHPWPPYSYWSPWGPYWGPYPYRWGYPYWW